MQVVEICINTDQKADLRERIEQVYLAGAQRIELCASMAEEGLTPDPQSIAIARKAFADRAGVLVMIRPRAGDFYYTQAEIQRMQQQISCAAQAGANGVVIGILDGMTQGFNLPAMRLVIQQARELGLQVSCHRAFDAVADKALALQQLLELGVDRLLTTGGIWGDGRSAIENINGLQQLISVAATQIEIVIAGGVNANMISELQSQLQLSDSRVSYHAYSGALINHQLNPDAVQAMVNGVS